ncbi:iron-regulated protein frpC [Candidatus Rhodobacter oscarellae]|uniref:Iron-regulated protein frpC n=1 Tax=Candidatus Rhodobacter oscarellae TaxID=1675527 RepID=A0A0J9E8X6_9RHOB|nr:Hint domain-containing protein [Candidatus Rhodobacter lobularis]KMW59242.1 iron-regulated protein frpC [Candidatus Rhodobacter lobularis]
MPDLYGTTFGNDTIDVSNNLGTLNGAPQGSPIDDINLGGGNSTVTITNSMIGVIDRGLGTMDITASDSTISGLTGQMSDVTLNLTNVDTIGTFDFGGTDLQLTWSGGTIGGPVVWGSGTLDVHLSGVDVTSTSMSTGFGDSIITLEDVSFASGTTFNIGGGTNVIEITGSTEFGSGSSINASIGSDTLSLPDGSVISIGGTDYTVGVDSLPSGWNLDGTVTLPGGSTFSFSDFDSFAGTGPVCFAQGTRIATPRGEVAVEALRLGDKVRDARGDAVEICWIGRQRMDFAPGNARHQPIEFKIGALGPDQPKRALRVSPQHRMLMRDATGAAVLAPAKGLLGLPGVRSCHGVRSATYFSLLLERHSLVRANGAWVESFYPGVSAMSFLGLSQARKVQSLIHDRGLDYRRPVLPCLTVSKARRLAELPLEPRLPLDVSARQTQLRAHG